MPQVAKRAPEAPRETLSRMKRANCNPRSPANNM